MEYLVTQAEMKQYDNNTITRLKMPSLVLMERAALITVEQIRKERGDGAYRVLVVAGCGNNGGDGFAIGRILLLQGCQVDFVLLGPREKCSEETARQIDILEQSYTRNRRHLSGGSLCGQSKRRLCMRRRYSVRRSCRFRADSRLRGKGGPDGYLWIL